MRRPVAGPARTDDTPCPRRREDAGRLATASPGRTGPVLHFPGCRTGGGRDGFRSLPHQSSYRPAAARTARAHRPGLGPGPSPDGRYLLSGSGDQTLRIWQPAHTKPLLSLFVAGNDWIAWTPEGYFAASPGGEGLMGWQVNAGPESLAAFHPAAHFAESLYRPDVLRRLLTAGSLDEALHQADRDRGTTTPRAAVGDVLPPRVRIVAPRPGGPRLTTPQLEVQAVAQSTGSHSVAHLILAMDGRPYRGVEALRRGPSSSGGQSPGILEHGTVPGQPSPECPGRQCRQSGRVRGSAGALPAHRDSSCDRRKQSLPPGRGHRCLPRPIPAPVRHCGRPGSGGPAATSERPGPVPGRQRQDGARPGGQP